MEVRKVGKNLVINHRLKSNENFKIQESTKSSSVFIFKKPQLVKGFSNSCGDGKGILLIDYDNTSEGVVLEDYKLLQRKFKLTPGFLFKTKENNYHVICVKKFFHPEIFEILKHTRCDSNYSTMPLRNIYRNYVLRIGNKKGSKKPKFRSIIGENINLKEEVSSAHINLLRKLYSSINVNFQNEDGLRVLKLQEYETR